MIKTKVNAGICGFNSEITADCKDGQNANITFTTECPNLKPLEEKLKSIDGFATCFGKIATNSTYQLLDEYIVHPACPVPCALIKATEAACGLALPKDATITIEKI